MNISRLTPITPQYFGGIPSIFEPESGKILDWGCNHAPTACLVKMLRGKAVELHGCEVGGIDVGAEEFRIFHGFANLDFRRLTHSNLLRYEDGFFDAVIGSAILEHVPNDSASRKELYRILKPA